MARNEDEVLLLLIHKPEDLHVGYFAEPKFNEDMINHLVMDQRRVGTLKALSKGFARINKHGEAMPKEPWAADFVKGKGHGLIFLLHGRPGVGKTCTAGQFSVYQFKLLDHHTFSFLTAAGI